MKKQTQPKKPKQERTKEKAKEKHVVVLSDLELQSTTGGSIAFCHRPWD